MAEAAAKLREMKLATKDNLYNAACGYVLSAKLAAGWNDFNHLQQDPDLVLLRDLPEFRKLMEPSTVPDLN